MHFPRGADYLRHLTQSLQSFWGFSCRFVVLLLCSLLTVRVTASLDLHVISSMVWYLKDQMVSLEDGHVPSWVFHSMSLY